MPSSMSQLHEKSKGYDWDFTFADRIFLWVFGVEATIMRPRSYDAPDGLPTESYEIRKGKEREPVRAEDYEELHREFSAHTFATLDAVLHEFDRD